MAGFCVSGFRVQQANPIPPAPPPGVTTVIIPGTFGSSPRGTNLGIFAPPNAAIGDLFLAFMNSFDPPNGFSMASFIPAGWSIVREEINPGVGSLHGPMYTGIAQKFAVLADTLPGASYTFQNTLASGGFLNVAITCIRNAAGIDATALTEANAAASLTVTGVACAAGGETVLVAGFYGTGSGSTIASSGGLPPATPFPAQADQVFYQSGPGSAGTSTPQTLTCSNSGDAFSGYQVSITAA